MSEAEGDEVSRVRQRLKQDKYGAIDRRSAARERVACKMGRLKLAQVNGDDAPQLSFRESLRQGWEWLESHRNLDREGIRSRAEESIGQGKTRYLKQLEKDHVMGVVKMWGRQLRSQRAQRAEKRERKTLVEAADMLARLEQRSRMNLGRHDEMERRRKELADLKEGMTTLVEPRRARHRASTGASRWDDTNLPIPPAAITAFRHQMQQQADM